MSPKRTALVTGAATGIGRSAVLALARAGYDVAINYSSSAARGARNRRRGRRSSAPKTLLVRCDVSDEAGVRAMLEVGRARPSAGSTC